MEEAPDDDPATGIGKYFASTATKSTKSVCKEELIKAKAKGKQNESRRSHYEHDRGTGGRQGLGEEYKIDDDEFNIGCTVALRQVVEMGQDRVRQEDIVGGQLEAERQKEYEHKKGNASDVDANQRDQDIINRIGRFYSTVFPICRSSDKYVGSGKFVRVSTDNKNSGGSDEESQDGSSSRTKAVQHASRFFHGTEEISEELSWQCGCKCVSGSSEKDSCVAILEKHRADTSQSSTRWDSLHGQCAEDAIGQGEGSNDARIRLSPPRISGSPQFATRSRWWPLLTGCYDSLYDERNMIVTKWLNHTGGSCNSKASLSLEIVDENQLNEQGEQWPLYTPKMLPLLLSKIEAFASLDKNHVSSILDWTRKADLYCKVMRNVPRQARTRYKNVEMSRYINQLLESGILQRADKKQIRSWCRMWCLPEAKKARKRLIVDPRQLNECVKAQWKELGMHISFPALHEIRAAVWESAFITDFDYKCYYYQIPLEEEVRPYFGVSIGDEIFWMCRLPMGFCGSVSVANSLSKLLSREALKRAVILAITMIQVDNTYFLTRTEIDGAAAAKKLHEVAKECQVTIGEFGAPRSEATVLGAIYNCAEKTVCVAPKFVAKHQQLLGLFFAEEEAPLLVWWRVLAVLIRVVLVLDFRLCHSYFMLRVIRHLARMLVQKEANWTTVINKQEVSQVGLSQMKFGYQQMFLANTPRRIVPRIEGSDYVFSDASSTGIGAILWSGNTLTVWSRQLTAYEKRLHINEVEAIALGEATKWAKAISPMFFVDSQVVALAVKKGHSKNFIINKTISRLSRKYPAACIQWIPSEWNPADGPSRTRQHDNETREIGLPSRSTPSNSVVLGDNV